MDIREFRKKYNFSQEQLGRLVGVSKSTISLLEQGKYLNCNSGIKVVNFIRTYHRHKSLIQSYSYKFNKKGSLCDFFRNIWRKL